jgi:hypothetical protein
MSMINTYQLCCLRIKIERHSFHIILYFLRTMKLILTLSKLRYLDPKFRQSYDMFHEREGVLNIIFSTYCI